MIACIVLLIWSGLGIIRYCVDGLRVHRQRDEMTALMKQPQQSEAPNSAPNDQTILPPPPAAVPTLSMSEAASTLPTVSNAVEIPEMWQHVSGDRLSLLREKYPDVCGWLRIRGGNTLDLPVVQRDNTFFLDHDYSAQPNVNGAIFLDESVPLIANPRVCILYGHNMKSLEMFGFLHRYDDPAFLRENWAISFDTRYGQGEYAVFAEGVVSLEPADPAFAAFYLLPGAEPAKARQILAELRRLSVVSTSLDVTPTDPLLLLVTCTGDDQTRRFVAARAIRSDETVGELSEIYHQALLK